MEGIQNAAVPQNKSELKSLMWLMTYNARFLPALASVLHPFYQLLKKDEIGCGLLTMRNLFKKLRGW